MAAPSSSAGRGEIIIGGVFASAGTRPSRTRSQSVRWPR